MRTFTPLRVSTITCTATVGAGCVDLDAEFLAMRLVPLGLGLPGVLSVRSADAAATRPARLHVPGKTPFGVQLSMKVLPACASHRAMSVKLFKNGSIHVAGAATELAGRTACDCVAAALSAPARATDFRVRMVNSDVRASCPIDRSALFDHMRGVQETATYDPGVHAAVRLTLFFSKSGNPDLEDGVCRCVNHCGAKVAKRRTCVLVAVAVYASGCICLSASGCVKYARRGLAIVQARVVASDARPPSTIADRLAALVCKARATADAACGPGAAGRAPAARPASSPDRPRKPLS